MKYSTLSQQTAKQIKVSQEVASSEVCRPNLSVLNKKQGQGDQI